MDYTPISARRVVTAFAITTVVALLPILWLAAAAEGARPHSVTTSQAAAGVALAFLIVAAVLAVGGRRMVRRFASA